MDRQTSTGMVSLIGAGPGDPALITVAGWQRLQTAQCVVYDRLIDTRLIDAAPAEAEKIYVGKSAATHCTAQAEINDLLIAHAKQGKRVVRLKGGDPFLFARGAEEAEALQKAGIAYEVIPGVTAALACAATASIPLTHRAHASAVAFITGHEDPTKPSSTIDWPALAKFPGTLVVYMGLTRLAAIASVLTEHGKPADTEVALVQWGGTNRQQVVMMTLADACQGPPAALASPVLAIVGSVVSVRRQLGWFEQRPLAGQTILLPRPREQAQTTAKMLEDLGARVLIEPAVTIEPPADWAAVDAAIDRLHQFDWLIFTSVNGVRGFMQRCWDRWNATSGDFRSLAHCKLIAIGPRTAEELAAFHLRADTVRSDGRYRSEDLLETLTPQAKGKQVLLARADRGVDVLPTGLRAAGAIVEQVTVYRQMPVATPSSATLQALKEHRVDWGLLTSSNIAIGVMNWLREHGLDPAQHPTRWLTISATTSTAVRDAGAQVAAEATDNTLEGMIATLLGEVMHQQPA